MSKRRPCASRPCASGATRISGSLNLSPSRVRLFSDLGKIVRRLEELRLPGPGMPIGSGLSNLSPAAATRPRARLGPSHRIFDIATAFRGTSAAYGLPALAAAPHSE